MKLPLVEKTASIFFRPGASSRKTRIETKKAIPNTFAVMESGREFQKNKD